MPGFWVVRKVPEHTGCMFVTTLIPGFLVIQKVPEHTGCMFVTTLIPTEKLVAQQQNSNAWPQCQMILHLGEQEHSSEMHDVW